MELGRIGGLFQVLFTTTTIISKEQTIITEFEIIFIFLNYHIYLHERLFISYFKYSDTKRILLDQLAAFWRVLNRQWKILSICSWLSGERNFPFLATIAIFKRLIRTENEQYVSLLKLYFHGSYKWSQS